MNTSEVASAPPVNAGTLPARRIVYRTRGRQHGPIVRLLSPSDEAADLIKPFVFLDYIDVGIDSAPRFGFHPHSGIATLTLLLGGGFSYEDSAGDTGTMKQGAVEWMQAGGGVWHRGYGIGERINGFQLWLALPPELETSPAVSRYLPEESFGNSGPARVILGDLDGTLSPIASPSSINYLDVRLREGAVWQYQPPAGHDVAWIAVHRGKVLTPETVSAGELVVFSESENAISFRAQGDASFILGSAKKHPHDLVLGHYSVHTSEAALELGEANIAGIGRELERAGKR